MVAVPGASMNINSLANLRPAKKGEVRNPSGVTGAVRRLGKKFAEALEDDFNAHGVEAITEARKKDPARYLTIIASMIPKEATLNVNRSPFDELTTGQLAQLVDGLNQLSTVLFSGDGSAGEAAGEGELPPVH